MRIMGNLAIRELIAWVYHNLKVSKDFYVDTSKSNKPMMQTVGRKVKLEGNLQRDSSFSMYQSKTILNHN